MLQHVYLLCLHQPLALGFTARVCHSVPIHSEIATEDKGSDSDTWYASGLKQLVLPVSTTVYVNKILDNGRNTATYASCPPASPYLPHDNFYVGVQGLGIESCSTTTIHTSHLSRSVERGIRGTCRILPRIPADIV
jgi:hypothetical protein